MRKRFIKTSVCLSLLLLSAIFFGLIGCQSNDNPTPALNIEAIAQNLVADLSKQGYEVRYGYPALFGIEQCNDAIETMGNCYGNNPAAPYITPFVPSWPEEFVDPATKNAFGKPKDGYSSIYRLDPREAIIILALLPPPSKYFGFQTYIFTREGVINTNDDIYKWLLQFNNPVILKQFFDTSPNPKRLRIFGSMGNSNNNVVVENQSGTAFDQERFFIITPDQFMEKNMKAALLKAGVPRAEHIFVEPVSSAYNIGLTEEADDFTSLTRYAMPQDDDKAATWRTKLPIVVLRVREKNVTHQPEPYPPVVLDTRTANPEDWLKNDLQRLITEIKLDRGQLNATVLPVYDLQTAVDLVGPDCYQRGMNCLGDTQDTSYQGTLNLSLDNNEVYAVIGTLATTTGNATYVNLSLYRASTLWGVKSISDVNLQNTAKDYVGRVNNTDKFYLHYISRDCQKFVSILPACTSVTEDMVPKGDFLKIAQRNYIRPLTKRGPDSKQTLSPFIITFDGNKL